MNIIFLDIDGVLNYLPDDPRKSVPGFQIQDERCYGLNPDMVKNLKYILDKTDARIVVSSTWRHFKDYAPYRPNERWKSVLAKMLDRSEDELFIGDTPSLQTRHNDDEGISEYTLRGKEIRKWVNDNKNVLETPLRMCVIDDEVIDIVGVINPKFVVRVNRRRGLTKGDANRAIDILNGTEETNFSVGEHVYVRSGIRCMESGKPGVLTSLEGSGDKQKFTIKMDDTGKCFSGYVNSFIEKEKYHEQ